MKKFGTRFFAVFLTIVLCVGFASATTLIPGGQVIGLQISDDTVSVAGFHETLGCNAKSAGLLEGDRIVSVEGATVKNVEDIRKALAVSDGTVNLSVMRKGKTLKVKLSPVATADGPKLGVYLRQGISGLGTVTFYQEETGKFGALGHGVNTPGGKLLQCRGGTVYRANVFSVKKGAVGKPGQLLGQLTEETSVGTVAKNTAQGVFGAMTPKADTALPVGQAKVGDAVIRSTVCDQGMQEYSVEILKVYPSSNDRTRNLLLQVTDQELLDTTGGIVQGMSGSPIIQDGYLVGAVTHVLVNDPTTGYGIFIENMLDAAA